MPGFGTGQSDFHTAQLVFILSDTSLDYVFSAHTRYPQPFSFRARTLLGELFLPRPELLFVAPWMFPAVHFCRSLPAHKADLSGYITKLLFLYHASEQVGCTPLFTDGSKSNAGVSFGAVFPDFTRCGSLPPYTSIFTSELTAILLPLSTLYPLQVEKHVIFCDSMAALSSIENNYSSHPLVTKIFIWLIL